MVPLSLLPDLLSNIPLLAISLIIRMSFTLFHDMPDLKQRENRKRNVKRESLELFSYRELRKNVLKINVHIV